MPGVKETKIGKIQSLVDQQILVENFEYAFFTVRGF